MSDQPGIPTASRRRLPSLSFNTMKWLSFTHSGVYLVLLAVWLIPGLALAESVFGFTHGIGWILMVIFVLLALQARVLGLRLAFAVAVLGAVAPFFGSYEFMREQKRRDAAPGDEAVDVPDDGTGNAVAESELAGTAR